LFPEERKGAAAQGDGDGDDGIEERLVHGLFIAEELEFMELVVESPFFEEFGVGAALGHAAVVEEEDPVGVFDGGQPMGDHNDRPVLHQFFDGVLDQFFRGGVQGTGGFVQNEDGRILQEGAGDGQPLLLPSGKEHAPFPDQSVQLLGHGFDEIPGVGRLQGLDDLLFAGSRQGIGDVVPDRVVEKDRFLGHHPDLAAQGIQGDVAEIFSVDDDLPAGGIVEAQHQRGERRLPAPGRAHQGQDVPFVDRHIDVLDHGCVGPVGKADAAELDGLFERRQCLGVRAGDDGRFHVEKFEDPVRAGQGLLERRVAAGEVLDGLIEGQGAPDESEERSGGPLSGHDVFSAQPQDGGHADGSEEFHHGAGGRFHLGQLQADVEESAVLFLEPVDLVLLLLEGLDHGDARDALLDHHIEVGHLLLPFPSRPPQFLPEPGDEPSGDGEDDHGEQRELPVEVEQESRQEQDRQTVPHDHHGDLGQGVLEELGVVGQPRDESGRIGVREKIHGQRVDVAEDLIPDLLDDGLPHFRGEIVVEIGERRFSQIEQEDQQHHRLKGFQVAGIEGFVHHLFEQPHGGRRQDGDAGHRQQRKHHVADVMAEVAEDPTEVGHVIVLSKNPARRLRLSGRRRRTPVGVAGPIVPPAR